jgi:hypothetical protein
MAVQVVHLHLRRDIILGNLREELLCNSLKLPGKMEDSEKRQDMWKGGY